MQCHVTVPLLVARKQMNADQAVNAMPCKYRVPADRTWYTRLTWGMQKAKFLVELKPFPPNQSDGKKMFGSQLMCLQESPRNYVKVLSEESVC